MEEQTEDLKLIHKGSKLTELIKNAYDIAQKENHTFTYDEAKRYDPLISTLFEALSESDMVDLSNNSTN